MGGHISMLRRWAEHLFAVALLVTAGRFTYSAAKLAAANAEQAWNKLAAATDVAKVEASTPAEVPKSENPVAGDLVPMMITVSHGDYRSDVFIDGTPVGRTAYVGSISCQRGADVHIRIVPKRGPAIERVGRCDGQMLYVTAK